MHWKRPKIALNEELDSGGGGGPDYKELWEKSEKTQQELAARLEKIEKSSDSKEEKLKQLEEARRDAEKQRDEMSEHLDKFKKRDEDRAAELWGKLPEDAQKRLERIKDSGINTSVWLSYLEDEVAAQVADDRATKGPKIRRAGNIGVPKSGAEKLDEDTADTLAHFGYTPEYLKEGEVSHDTPEHQTKITMPFKMMKDRLSGKAPSIALTAENAEEFLNRIDQIKADLTKGRK